MAEYNEEFADWEPCPAGTMRKLAEQAGRSGQNQPAHRYYSAAAVGVILGVAGTLLLALRPSGLPLDADRDLQLPGGLACVTVRDGMEQFAAGGLEQDLRRRFVEHLSVCEACRSKYEARYGEIPELAARGTMLAPVIGLSPGLHPWNRGIGF